MAAPPFMRLWIGDYLLDTMHLNRGEHGAYLLLLMAMFRAGGKLPADDAKLAKVAKCSADEWADIRATILAFFRRRGAVLTHKRVTFELLQYGATVNASKKAGLASAAKRANKNSDLASTSVEPTFNENPTNQNQNQNQKEKSSEDKESSATPPLALDPDGTAWTSAKLLLSERGGMGLDKAGAFFGKLLKDHGLQARELLVAVTQATVNGTQDPKAYLAAAAAGVAKRQADRALSPAEKAMRSNIQ